MPGRTNVGGHTIAFYDGGCNLCRREIAHSRSIDRDNIVEWRDINAHLGLLESIGVTHEQAMKRMHVLDAEGVLRDGAEAFVALWSALPYYKWLARVIRYIRAVGLIEAAYRRFAAWRYARRRDTRVCAMSQPTPGDER